jgi:hypothetical protein
MLFQERLVLGTYKCESYIPAHNYLELEMNRLLATASVSFQSRVLVDKYRYPALR